MAPDLQVVLEDDGRNGTGGMRHQQWPCAHFAIQSSEQDAFNIYQPSFQRSFQWAHDGICKSSVNSAWRHSKHYARGSRAPLSSTASSHSSCAFKETRDGNATPRSATQCHAVPRSAWALHKAPAWSWPRQQLRSKLWGQIVPLSFPCRSLVIPLKILKATRWKWDRRTRSSFFTSSAVWYESYIVWSHFLSQHLIALVKTQAEEVKIENRPMVGMDELNCTEAYWTVIHIMFHPC